MSVERAAEVLRAGGLVVFPTETVYGVGADATNPHAVARIFAAKGRPQFNPLISHVLSLADAERHGELHPLARALIETFWPGPLTIVVPRRADSPVAELACAGLATIALRSPSHPLARELLAAFGGPVVAPSANRSGHVSATTAAHAAADLEGVVDLILDGGPSTVGLESTIVAIDADGRATLLRPGAISRDAIEAITGRLAMPALNTIAAPGMMESHYAPRARIVLDAAAPPPGAAYLAFGAEAPPGGLSLSISGDLTEAAANLYAHLRALDATGADTIAVAPIPGGGLAEAIRDRLARAAAPR
ncbi:MAG: threonylcarbamoyl-AMP synthase [Hyphomonadaceae bacterium]|jgi:L-threonylcarbamoyladenylate synthase|nr:threonylcarbamoyl-AMP synthase [Hyphomonadaceae bacterium]